MPTTRGQKRLTMSSRATKLAEMRATTHSQISMTGGQTGVCPATTSPTGSSAAHVGSAVRSRPQLCKSGNRCINQILGGWSTSSFMKLAPGAPFGVIENNAAAIYPTAATVRSNADRAVRENPNWRDNVLGETFFDPSSFAAPAQYTFGNSGAPWRRAGRDCITDLSVLKNFVFRESHRLQFRVETLNFLNRANFALPNQSRGVANFGRISALQTETRPALFNSACITSSEARKGDPDESPDANLRGCCSLVVAAAAASETEAVQFFEKKVVRFL